MQLVQRSLQNPILELGRTLLQLALPSSTQSHLNNFVCFLNTILSQLLLCLVEALQGSKLGSW
jgi:hypothetical protein